MLVKSLKINNLRNLVNVDISPSDSINIFIGDNGAGKTSVLESLILLSKGRSFRSNNIDTVIGPEDEMVRVVTEIAGENGELRRVGIERGSKDWKARVDGQDVTQLSDLAKHFPFVLLEPNSHELITGKPEIRRRFLDWVVFHVEHDYLENWRAYMRAVKQRNAALRLREVRTVQALDPLVSRKGHQVHEARVQITEELKKHLSEVASEIAPRLNSIEVSYNPGFKGDQLSEALESGLEKDIERGFTYSGPHRADLSLLVNKSRTRDQLSRGEQKITAASLLLAQSRLMHSQGLAPLLLLDDLSSEFDMEHVRSFLTEASRSGQQLWITGVDSAPYDFLSKEQTKMFHVEHGVIRPETQLKA